MTSNKKRKRDNAPAPIGDVTLINGESVDFPPIVGSYYIVPTPTHSLPITSASTVGVTLPLLPFKPYTRPAVFDTGKKKRVRSEYLLHGANARLDYEGHEVAEDSQYHQYYVGIFDPDMNTVELHVAPKVHVKPSIKAHRQRDLEVQAKGSEFTVFLPPLW
jgi:DNA-directed RNA polymerase I subunit RPA49